MVWRIAGLIAALATAAAGARDAVSLEYRLDEASGPVLADSGPRGMHARAAQAKDETVQDASFTPGEMGVWQPLLRQGVQIKGIREGSDRLTADDEMPIVLDRGRDYEIDCAGGRVKALAGGRAEAGKIYLAEVTYSNPGPARAAGPRGGALRFDGVDDYAECADARLAGVWSKVEIEVRFALSGDGADEPVLVSIGPGVVLGVERGMPYLRHDGLGHADGGRDPVTRALTPVAIEKDAWHCLRATCSGSTVVLQFDGREIGRSEGLSGAVRTEAPLRIGGTVDPHFYKGLVDHLAVHLDPGTGA